MPKKLNDVKQNIIACTREELLAHPDTLPPLRKIAAECGISVGTIYNYCSSQEELIVSVFIDDWRKDLQAIDEKCQKADTFLDGIVFIVSCIESYNAKYAVLFHQLPLHSDQKERQHRHIQFRNELRNRVMRLAGRFSLNISENIASFYTEALIACALQDDLSIDDFNSFTAQFFQQKEE